VVVIECEVNKPFFGFMDVKQWGKTRCWLAWPSFRPMPCSFYASKLSEFNVEPAPPYVLVQRNRSFAFPCPTPALCHPKLFIFHCGKLLWLFGVFQAQTFLYANLPRLRERKLNQAFFPSFAISRYQAVFMRVVDSWLCVDKFLIRKCVLPQDCPSALHHGKDTCC